MRIMKASAVALCLAFGSAGFALAADMPAEAPPYQHHHHWVHKEKAAGYEHPLKAFFRALFHHNKSYQ